MDVVAQKPGNRLLPVLVELRERRMRPSRYPRHRAMSDNEQLSSHKDNVGQMVWLSGQRACRSQAPSDDGLRANNVLSPFDRRQGQTLIAATRHVIQGDGTRTSVVLVK
jgi:hypothetical protein